MGWYAVFSREVLILYKKIGQMGYVFSSIISPFIYLFAFGYGLGSRVEVAGGYLPFLAGGIIGITVMINAFQQTATSVSVGKMYYHIFQNLVLSPIRDFEVIFGIIGAGMLRDLFWRVDLYHGLAGVRRGEPASFFAGRGCFRFLLLCRAGGHCRFACPAAG